MAKIIKLNSAAQSASPDGEVKLAAGRQVRMRMWREEPPTEDKPLRRHDYEVVGFVLSGRAELEIEGEVVELAPGDSWLVPAGASHTYRIKDTFSAVESLAPASAA